MSQQNQPEYESFLKSALALKGSVTPKVMKKVCFMIIYASLVSCLCYLFPSLVLPIGPFEYGGLIMGLILVFRINSGYDRWWEARKLWGNVVNQTRNLTILLVNYTKQGPDDWIHKTTNMISALPYLMKDHLREQTNLQSVSDLLDVKNLRALGESKHHPIILASMMTAELQTARNRYELDDFVFLRAQAQVEQLIDAQGACERILKTPIPFVMAVKSRRFILFFLLMLPFALAEISLLISPFIAGMVSYAIFSLDQIGLELQNPFSQSNLSHLPLDHICKTIENNIKEIREHHSPKI